MPNNFIKLYDLDRLQTGTMVRVKSAGHTILLANIDENVYAVDDMCTHEDASLAKGSLHGDCVKCPLHGSRFNLKTGEAVDEPAEDKLNTYAVKIDGNDILVQLS